MGSSVSDVDVSIYTVQYIMCPSRPQQTNEQTGPCRKYHRCNALARMLFSRSLATTAMGYIPPIYLCSFLQRHETIATPQMQIHHHASHNDWHQK
jgi:hypothetical protein